MRAGRSSLSIPLGPSLYFSPDLTCDDGSDNDEDALIDFPNDPGCFRPASNIESPQCQDGINNDLGQDPNPGRIDYDAGYSANGSPDPNGPDPQ